MADDSLNSLIAGQHNAGVIDSLANPPQINVLGSISRAADAAKSVMGMRAAKAQQAWGNALQQATDPNTGAVDYPRAQAIAARDPDAVMHMETGLESSSGRMNEQVIRGHALNGWLQGAAGALPLNATRQQVLDMLNKGGASGIIPSDILAKELATVPTDEKQIPAFVQQLRDSALQAENQFKLHYGTMGTLEQGGATTGTRLDPYTGALTRQGAPITTGQPSPSDLLKAWPDRVPERDAQGVPTGKMITVTTGEWLEMNGRLPPGTMDKLKAGGSVPAATAPAPKAPAAMGTAAPAKSAASVTTFNLPTGRAALTLSPDEAFKLDQAGPQFKKERDDGVAAVQQSALLGNMLAASTGFAPGEGADAMQKFRSTVQYWAPGIAKNFLGIDPAAIANQEDFSKIAAQIENAQGAQSDKRLAVVQASTPHAQMTPAGVDKILRQLQGNSDYLQYRAKMAAVHPKQYDYSSFQQEVQKLDPRVFQITRMTDPQRKEYWSQLDSTAKAELGAAIRYKAAMDKKLAGG